MSYDIFFIVFFTFCLRLHFYLFRFLYYKDQAELKFVFFIYLNQEKSSIYRARSKGRFFYISLHTNRNFALYFIAENGDDKCYKLLWPALEELTIQALSDIQRRISSQINV
jgi:hypothetical protein